MGALAGFILGYYLGAKQGPEGYAQLRQALETGPQPRRLASGAGSGATA
jgi:hypothetical protein